jgi:hypothetical protein
MKLKKEAILSIIYFVITATLIAYFFPREGKFRYQFNEGKPWRYDLLTAPGDFPIYKTDEEIKVEKDSVRSNFVPYYQMNPNIKGMQIEKLQADYQSSGLPPKANQNYIRYIESQLSTFYD